MLDETAPGIDDVTADPAATRAFIKVPTRLIGKLLDHGKVSGVALHLLAVKIWRDGHVLNEKDVRKRYCIGERRFRAAIALLKETGLLQRTQYRRNTWAVEELVTSSGGFVMLPTNLLHERSGAWRCCSAVARRSRSRMPMARSISSSSASRRAASPLKFCTHRHALLFSSSG